MILTVYSRPGCHLCEEAVDAILVLRAEGYRFELREIDIDSDEGLLKRYLERIPVILLDGEVVSELVLDPAALRASLDTVTA
ncbi:MAG: glutaredoxin family protein [Solirubrobacterales bacterium]